MPIWVSVMLSILGGTGLASLIMSAIWHWQKRGIEKARKYDEEQREKMIRKVIHDEVQPMHDEITKISEKMDVNNEATVTLLRDRMKCSLNYCRKQGFASSTDKANWTEIYNSYKKLGGNHFREYVNRWKEEMEHMPEHPDDSDTRSS